MQLYKFTCDATGCTSTEITNGSAIASARILIIEDNPTDMELMVYLLTAFGYTPMTATDGESGVEAARASVPDLIISDIHLPKLDG